VTAGLKPRPSLLLVRNPGWKQCGFTGPR
jgi:hypothetical protein